MNADTAPALPAPPPLPRARVLLRGADPALAALLAEWLNEVADLVLEPEPPAAPAPRADLHIVDVPFPRRTDPPAGPLQEARGRGVPVLMLSSTFLGAIDCHGPVAAALGVDGVLPKPVARDALLAAVRRLLAGSTATPEEAPR
jgi:DNA-binding NarL/FixJ family response regulator